MGVVITKKGSVIQIDGYNQSATASSVATVSLNMPTQSVVTVNGTTVALNPVGTTPATFYFVQETNGKNRITEINGVDVTAYTALQVKDALEECFISGFSGTVPVVARKVVILNLTTSATGTTFVNFADSPCNSVDVVNVTGTDLEYKRNNTGLTMYVPDQTARNIPGITNANQIYFRRIDVSNTQVTFTAEAITA